MNRILPVLTLAAMLTTGCATDRHEYVMATKDGRLLISTTRPQLVPKADLYVYWDEFGNLQTNDRADLGQVINR